MSHVIGLVLAIPLGQLAPVTLGSGLASLRMTGTNLAAAVLLFLRVAGNQLGGTQGAAFVELRFEHVESIQFLLNHRVDGYRYVRLKGIGLLKRIRVEEEDRIRFQCRYIGTEERDRDHER